jgi:hypothetical protein
MSLFQNDRYRWRETYFVLFQEANRPSAADIERALRGLGDSYRITGVRCGEGGEFESLTIESPFDFTAMDVSYVCGEEVQEQVGEMLKELRRGKLSPREQAQWNALSQCNARFDVYHFQRIVNHNGYADGDEDDFIDPGSLLLVLQRLAKLSHGVGIDPQTGVLL